MKFLKTSFLQNISGWLFILTWAHYKLHYKLQLIAAVFFEDSLFLSRKYNERKVFMNVSFVNNSPKEKPCFSQFSTIIYWKRGLAAPGLSLIVTQSINFKEYKCLEKVIQQLDKKWMVASFSTFYKKKLSSFFSWHRKSLFLRGFILKPTESSLVPRAQFGGYFITGQWASPWKKSYLILLYSFLTYLYCFSS